MLRLQCCRNVSGCLRLSSIRPGRPVAVITSAAGVVLPDNPEHRRPHQRMQSITFRVDEATAEQLRQLAAEEQESLSVIGRRLLRRALRPVVTASDRSLARAHEGTGRDR